jgi:anti-anti-sigma factor
MTNIKIEDNEAFRIMRLSGEFIGGDETDELNATLKKAAAETVNKLILDLSGVTFLNSMALGVLLSANALFHKHNGRVVLANPSEYLKSIFETTKLSLIFTIDKSLEEAIETISK